MSFIPHAIATAMLSIIAVSALGGQNFPVAGSTVAGGDADLVCAATAEGTPRGVLDRVARNLGMDGAEQRVLRVRWSGHVVNDFQSDRSYEPFFSLFQAGDTYFDSQGGGLATRSRGGAYVGRELPATPFILLGGPWAAWALRDTLVRPAGNGADMRHTNPWAAVYDFIHAGEARLEGRCVYRDYPRIALTRAGIFGTERLLVDPKTMIPVGLVREEPHPLWGQVRVDFVWSNWNDVTGGGVYPFTAFRMVDGKPNIGVTATSVDLVPVDSAPSLTIPDTALRADTVPVRFARPTEPDTVRVNEHTYLLVNPMYTIAVTLLRDTVFVLDATTSEARARLDADWVKRLFPGQHPVVLVVTDLAWPHIGGVRYWVASGATVVSHRASRGFLRQVVDRRWTREPDVLEQSRSRVRFAFRPVSDSLVLAGGDLVLHAIDGIATEGALIGFLEDGAFLWASDYIQNSRQASGYMREVFRATRRVGIRPDNFAAQHVQLTPWSTVESLLEDELTTEATDRPDGGVLRTGSLTRTWSMSRNGQRANGGVRTQQLTRGTYQGRAAIFSVRVFETPQGAAIDSSIADAATLLPIRHVGVHTSRTMTLDFDGARVTGSYQLGTDAPRRIDQPMPTPPYDASLFDLVFAALPLAEGYHARLPFYVYEQGGAPLWYDARVAGTETVTLGDDSRVDTWIVDVSESAQARARLWVTKGEEREIVRSTQYIAPGMEYTLSR
jgi:hypothetical protein